MGLDFRRQIYNNTVVDNLSSAFGALSDPTRRMILDRLTRGPATVNELAQPFDITQQAVSKHVACLERARLIVKQRRGRERVCALRPGPLRDVAEWANSCHQFWHESFARLDTLLPEIEKEERNRRGHRK